MRGRDAPLDTDAPTPNASRNPMTYDAIPELSLATSDARRAIPMGSRVHCKKQATGRSLTQRVRTALKLGEALDDCLLQALDMAVANGDAEAAELIAAECMALVELRRGMLERNGSLAQACTTTRRQPSPGKERFNHEERQ